MQGGKENLRSPEIPQELDALIVLGNNIGMGWAPNDIKAQRFHLSPRSRINVLATGILFKAGISDRIIFSSGKTAGKDTPSEAEAMKRHLLRIFPSIPEQVITLEEDSLNTYTNAQEVRRIMEQQGLKEVGLVSTGSHLKRAAYLFKQAGISFDPHNILASEEILRERRPGYVERYLKSDSVSKESAKEKRVYFVQRLPLGSQLLDFITRFTRNPNK